MKQILSTVGKLCWTYIQRIVLKVRLWWAHLQLMNIKKQINHLESSKSSDMKLLARFKEKVENNVYPDLWEL